jgi:hypothetical protein
MATEKSPRNPPRYSCEKCDFYTGNRKDFSRHCGTRKHRMLALGSHEACAKSGTDAPHIHPYVCSCGHEFMQRQSLWRHKKRCDQGSSVPEPSLSASMFMDILDDNKELRSVLCAQQESSDKKQAELLEQMKEQQQQMCQQQEQIKEQQKQMAELIPKVGNITNNNQRFNLQFFLNETCKEAINWGDFVRSLEVGAEDFEDMTSSSMTDGVAKVICHGIQDLGVYKRPIHCVDMKRRKMCIKDSDTWNHDEQEVDGLLHKANVSTKGKYNQVLCQWEKDHPRWQDDEEETNTYLHLLGKVIEATDEKKCAIEVARNTVIPKDCE